MRVDYNPYEGTVVEGTPSAVISGGKVIIEKGQFVGARGAGRFLKRQQGVLPA